MEVHADLLRKAQTYQPTAQALDPIRHVPLLFAVGISGAGKDTVLKKLVATHPEMYQFMVSYTTRKPRENRGIMERDGIDYHFIDFATAERMIDEGAFVEVNYYADNIYGTGIEEIAAAKKSGRTVISDVDVHGVANYVRLGMNVKPIFLLPPSYDIWWQRLTSRYAGKTDEADLLKRMKTSLVELTQALENDFFYLVVNDTLDKTVEHIGRIVRDEAVEARPQSAIDLIHQVMAEIRQKLAAVPSASPE